MDRAGVIAFPPLLFGGTLAVALLLRYVFPTPLLPHYVAWPLGATLLGAGVALLGSAFWQFKRARTTIHPGGSTTAIVPTGPYRFTRNPMYLALTLVFTGVCAGTNAWWGLLLLFPLLYVMQKGVIEREEGYLTQKFGEEYLQYKARVRRWL